MMYFFFLLSPVFNQTKIEKIIELDLDSADLNHLTESAEGVSKTNSLLGL